MNCMYLCVHADNFPYQRQEDINILILKNYSKGVKREL